MKLRNPNLNSPEYKLFCHSCDYKKTNDKNRKLLEDFPYVCTQELSLYFNELITGQNTCSKNSKVVKK